MGTHLRLTPLSGLKRPPGIKLRRFVDALPVRTGVHTNSCVGLFAFYRDIDI